MTIFFDERADVAYHGTLKSSPHRSERSDRAIQFAIKRCIDVVGSITALMLLAPLFLVVAVLIKLDSPGPVFFTQERWGQAGKRIRVYKFRSMRIESADRAGTVQAVKGDKRVTAIGAMLRRTNIDELPQLLNVLKGEMALVGPRCHPIGMLAAGMPYEELVSHYHLRHAVRPGITGLAQMRGLRGPTVSAAKSRQRIAADIYYIRNFNIWLDIKIMIGTLRTEVIGGSGF